MSNPAATAETLGITYDRCGADERDRLVIVGYAEPATTRDLAVRFVLCGSPCPVDFPSRDTGLIAKIRSYLMPPTAPSPTLHQMQVNRILVELNMHNLALLPQHLSVIDQIARLVPTILARPLAHLRGDDFESVRSLIEELPSTPTVRACLAKERSAVARF